MTALNEEMSKLDVDGAVSKMGYSGERLVALGSRLDTMCCSLVNIMDACSGESAMVNGGGFDLLRRLRWGDFGICKMTNAMSKQKKESVMEEINDMRKALRENVEEAIDVKKFWFEIMDSTVEQLNKMEMEPSESSEDNKTNESCAGSGGSRSMTRTDAGTENVVPNDDMDVSNGDVNCMGVSSVKARKRDRAVEPGLERAIKVPSNNNGRSNENDHSSNSGSARE